LAYKGYNQEKHSLAAYPSKADHLPDSLKKHNNQPGLCYKKDREQAFKVQNRLRAKLQL
jgi:hypothetical protein